MLENVLESQVEAAPFILFVDLLPRIAVEEVETGPQAAEVEVGTQGQGTEGIPAIDIIVASSVAESRKQGYGVSAGR